MALAAAAANVDARLSVCPGPGSTGRASPAGFSELLSEAATCARQLPINTAMADSAAALAMQTSISTSILCLVQHRWQPCD